MRPRQILIDRTGLTLHITDSRAEAQATCGDRAHSGIVVLIAYPNTPILYAEQSMPYKRVCTNIISFVQKDRGDI